MFDENGVFTGKEIYKSEYNYKGPFKKANKGDKFGNLTLTKTEIQLQILYESEESDIKTGVPSHSRAEFEGEVTLDGVSINQKWRQTRSDAAEKYVNQNQKLAKKIFRLPASSGEKQRLYGILNNSVEASSNLALANYRLKTKEYKNAQEKKALRKDVKNMKKLISQNSKDIKWVTKKIKKRA